MAKGILNLKRAAHRNKSYGKAPHKPVLLLSLIELIDEGKINQNRIYITPDLIGTFQKLWLKLVPVEAWQPRFFLPFFHLTGDKFWHLELAEGAEVTLTSSYSPKSLAALKDSIRYAWLDQDLYNALIIPQERRALKSELLQKYFPDKSYEERMLRKERKSYVQQLEEDFLTGKAASPKVKYEKIEDFEARSIFFKNRVPKIYNYTCVISGHQLQATTDLQMVDACHIKPWRMSKDDSVQNGISLSPTLHRAFDRHLLSIGEDYEVIVSKAFKENSNSPYNLSQFEGQRILLPKKAEWYPSQEALAWHRDRLLT